MVPHPDADDLALIALGEDLGTDVQAHVDDCPVCTDQVDTFRDTIDLAGLSDYGRDAPAPGPHVWDAIATELGFARDGAADAPAEPDGPGAPEAPAVAEPIPLAPRRTAGAARRRPRWALPLAAAVIGIAVGAGTVVLVQNREDAATVEAVAPLDPVQGGPLPVTEGQLGTAELVAGRTGQQVRVDVPGLPATDSSAYEVWLFGGDGRMVSLGTLADGSGSFTVPAGIDTNVYRTVDISDEPPDGNPTHSGISLVRGTFA
ncbi:MAG: anti-sigma factor [Nakamurella multipartita]|jgi:hypothetical protein